MPTPAWIWPSVDLAMELMGLVRSRILERLLDDGGSLREFIADVKLGMAREGQEH
jgi:peroxiredoxin family protein